MRISQIEPEATTDTTVSTIENTNTDTANADTKIELVLTPEQQIDADIEKQFGAKALANRKAIKEIGNKLGKAENQLVLNTFALGYKLVETYIELADENKKHFWKIVDTGNQSKKTKERGIELVAELKVVLSEAMNTDCGILDIANNVKLLVLDKKVLKLYNDNLAKAYKPTIVKINNMKHLSKSNWDLVCKGENEIYKKHMEVVNAYNQAIAEDELRAKKPDNIEINTFMGFTKAEPITLIKEISDNKKVIAAKDKEIAGLEEQLKELKKLVPLSTTDNGYTVTKKEVA